mmetsp:Transcript_96110/g.256868  ORF Transcript_96110/g.256868 Transcript_96110/m.256868 type:complete len:562 (-) Transcript_96110:539-2224(-)
MTRVVGCVEQDLPSGKTLRLPPKYQASAQIGEGSYGVVVEAVNRETHEKVAIKQIPDAFEHPTTSKRVLRELRLLRHLDHENVMLMRDLVIAEDRGIFRELCVVTELMESDLASVIKSSADLTDDHHSFFIYQLLRGLKWLHSAGVVHRDIKPRNLLVNSNCDLKICDFGLARIEFGAGSFSQLCPMTEYVCTRWYRAPEILLSFKRYSYKVDVWSVGCVFAELKLTRPLWKGSDSGEQLARIMQDVGIPHQELIDRIGPDYVRQFIRRIRREHPHLSTKVADWHRALAKAPKPVDEVAASFLTKMLQFDPDHRANVQQALEDPYLADLHDEADEPTTRPIPHHIWEFERRRIDERTIRLEMFEELKFWTTQQVQECAGIVECSLDAAQFCKPLAACRTHMMRLIHPEHGATNVAPTATVETTVHSPRVNRKFRSCSACGRKLSTKPRWWCPACEAAFCRSCVRQRSFAGRAQICRDCQKPCCKHSLTAHCQVCGMGTRAEKIPAGESDVACMLCGLQVPVGAQVQKCQACGFFLCAVCVAFPCRLPDEVVYDDADSEDEG